MKRHFQASFYLILCFLSIMGTCSDSKNNPKERKSTAQLQEELIEINKNSVEFEEKVIKKYIKDHNVTMKRTGTGLWYEIFEQGDGDSLIDGQRLKVEYKIYMLNDSLCYSSESKGPYEFRLGMADVETGIHEGVKLLRVGGKARFILPSYLAHGLLGDMNKIPPKTPAIYDLHLIEAK